MVIFRSDSRLAGAAYGDRQGTSSQDELTIISGWIAAGDGGGAVCLVWERSKAFCEPELITEENDLGGRD